MKIKRVHFFLMASHLLVVNIIIVRRCAYGLVVVYFSFSSLK